MMRTSLFAAVTLAAFVLVPVADAQTLTLNSGDNVTVSSIGTVGTIKGAPVVNSTTSYSNYTTLAAVQTFGTAVFTLGSGGSITAGPNHGGLLAFGSGPITITGGTFIAGDEGIALDTAGSSTVTITGGSFTVGSGGYGLFTANSGSIDLYGAFDGLALGQIQALPSGGTASSFTGTLQNNTTPQTFTYKNSGSITLHDVGLASALEPSQWAAFAIGLLGLGTLALKAKKRQAI